MLTLESVAPAWAIGARVGADETRVYVSRPNSELTPVSGTSELRVFPPSDGDKIILWTVANHVSMAQRGRSLPTVKDLWSATADAGYVATASAEVASASNTTEDGVGDDARFKAATEVYAKSGYTVRGSPAKKWLFDVDAWMRSAPASDLPPAVARGEVIPIYRPGRRKLYPTGCRMEGDGQQQKSEESCSNAIRRLVHGRAFDPISSHNISHIL